MSLDKLTTGLRRHGIGASKLLPLVDTDRGTVYHLILDGDAAVTSWLLTRGEVHLTGHWPVILGTEDDWQPQLDRLEDARDVSTDEILVAARAFDPLELLEVLRLRREEDYDFDPDPDDEPVRFWDAESGVWPETAVPSSGYVLSYDLSTGRSKPGVSLAFVPTPNGWEVPAILRFGDWNECPRGEEHVCVLRYWQERYGAELVCLSHDILELRVPRRPNGRDSALELARQQYVYCPDLVAQGTETVEALAAGLLHGSTWYFWWD